MLFFNLQKFISTIMQKRKCNKIDKRKVAMPACNEWFGASGGVARPTVCGEFGSLSPVRAAVKPPPAPSHQNVLRIITIVVFMLTAIKDVTALFKEKYKKNKLENAGANAGVKLSKVQEKL
jgi:hypothetical protein